MDNPWIIHGHPRIFMDLQGLGEPVGHDGGTGQHILGGNRSAKRQQRIPCTESKNPFRQA